jgi:LytS/YehU family sensor histidine kinase
MKPNYTNIIIHVVFWVLVLCIPINSIYQLHLLLNQPLNLSFIVLVSLLCFVLLFIFYFNYHYLIPKFLFTKKYWHFAIWATLCFLLIITAPPIVRGLFKSMERSTPTLKYIGPIMLSNAILLYLFIYLAAIGLAINNRLRKTEQEKANAQLSYLKTQINPHFLFNTLNGIYSITIGKSNQAAEMVFKLSEMMRYTLHDTQEHLVPLEKELHYIDNYIELQLLRFDESVQIEYFNKCDRSDFKIAPLLLIPFIENAFKHGTNAEEDSHIKIDLHLEKSILILHVMNNKVNTEGKIHEKSGLGIANTKDRLQLIYPNAHLLKIDETEDQFHVSLHITLS